MSERQRIVDFIDRMLGDNRVSDVEAVALLRDVAALTAQREEAERRHTAVVAKYNLAVEANDDMEAERDAARAACFTAAVPLEVLVADEDANGLIHQISPSLRACIQSAVEATREVARATSEGK